MNKHQLSDHMRRQHSPMKLCPNKDKGCDFESRDKCQIKKHLETVCKYKEYSRWEKIPRSSRTFLEYGYCIHAFYFFTGAQFYWCTKVFLLMFTGKFHLEVHQMYVRGSLYYALPAHFITGALKSIL